LLILIIDYHMCNLGSVNRAFQECGAEVIISSNPLKLEQATHIVLPGVGAFSSGMEKLKELGWVEAIKNIVLKENIPILGICLGMQLLGNKSFEKGETEGLKLIPGDIIKLEPNHDNERVPHVGWNELHVTQNSSILQSIPNGTDFYFVHSFHFKPNNKSDIIATSPYCGKFVSVIQRDLKLDFS